MRCVCSRLRTALIATAFIPTFTWADPALDITLQPEDEGKPEEKVVPPFKPDVGIPFQVKNNTPITQTLTISVSGIDADVDGGCSSVAADTACTVNVTPRELGVFRVTATSATKRHIGISETYPVAYRFATYNLSFDRTCSSDCTDNGKKRCDIVCPDGTTGYDVLKEEMALSRSDQKDLIDVYSSGADMDDASKALAEAAIQIRNVAEVIQRKNPDVILLTEFDNNGVADDDTAIQNFIANYLNESQNDQKPLAYEYTKSIPTNTGKPSYQDLDNDNSPEGPNDAWGHGYYHGQYAFAVFSKYPFDEGAVHTFQNFRWKDLPADNPIIELCNDPDKPIPDGMACGDTWYSSQAWKQHPLSSKNHIDLPIEITIDGNSNTIHLLASHPTPPIFDGAAKRNYKRNRDEIQFWIDYISGTSFTDDAKTSAALDDSAHFVIAGDMNADPDIGDGHLETIKELITHKKVNTAATTGAFRPTSNGAQEYLNSSDCKRNCQRANGNTITQVSGLKLDHVVPSASLSVVGSGVFWPASYEDGHYLVYDKTQGVDKGVSSDHRMVWVDLYIPSESTSSKTEL